MTAVPTSPSRAHGQDDMPPSPQVVAAILFVAEEGLADTLEAVRGQVYEAGSVAIVGGGEPAEAIAESHDISHSPSFVDFVAGLGPEIDAVWVVHGDARPRPDALAALVGELERNEASMVGSKILQADEPDRLESVGTATDVFGEPYSGLDPGEVDLEQYDVVRDVAFVSGVSFLVRRDLLKGLRGIDPTLPPVAAGMDMSQRARIAGGRVMVAPSSEVLHRNQCGHDVESWRELAGRMRAMLKGYRLVTLAWVVPLGFFLGLGEGIARLFLGKTAPARDFLLALGWNVLHLPSLVSARRSLRRVRIVGDEELFRYQVGGSMRLRALGTDLSERLGWAIDDEPAVVTEEELGPEVRRTGPVLAAIALLVLGLASRRLWFGAFPSVGFTLPGAEDTLSVLSTYAGGWNPAGLGSPEPLHPAPAVVALLETALGGLARPLITITSMALGLFGTSRLLRRFGVGGATRHFAGLVLFLGPMTAGLTGGAHWAGLIALGGLPWLVEAALAPWPAAWRLRVGRLSVMLLAAAFSAGFAPLTLFVPLVAAAAALPLLRPVDAGSVLRAALAAAFGAILTAPFLIRLSFVDLTAGGPFLEPWPGLPVVAVLLVAAVATVLATAEPHWRVAAWGGLLAGLGLLLSLVPGNGGEAAVAAVALASFGSAIVVGAALPMAAQAGRTATAVGAAGSLAAVALVLLSLVPVPGGQAGLPEDRWTGRLEFVSSLATAAGPGRVLVVGQPELLPGEWRTGNGYAYRLIWGDAPTFDQAWLATPRLGDAALARTLAEIDRGDVVRPGELLAPYAIRWLVILGDVPLSYALRAQVDMVEVPLEPGVRVFQNLSARPRADADGDEVWTATRAGAQGPPGSGRVRLADNAHPSWGPDWQQAEWANDLSGEEGVLSFGADPLRSWLAWMSVAMLFIGCIGALWGRKWR